MNGRKRKIIQGENEVNCSSDDILSRDQSSKTEGLCSIDPNNSSNNNEESSNNSSYATPPVDEGSDIEITYERDVHLFRRNPSDRPRLSTAGTYRTLLGNQPASSRNRIDRIQEENIISYFDREIIVVTSGEEDSVIILDDSSDEIFESDSSDYNNGRLHNLRRRRLPNVFRPTLVPSSEFFPPGTPSITLNPPRNSEIVENSSVTRRARRNLESNTSSVSSLREQLISSLPLLYDFGRPPYDDHTRQILRLTERESNFYRIIIRLSEQSGAYDANADQHVPRGLSSQKLNALTVHKFDKNNPCTTETCCICMDKYRHNNLIVETYPCTHMFHKKCILPWLKSNDTCPMCRAKVLEPPIVI